MSSNQHDLRNMVPRESNASDLTRTAEQPRTGEKFPSSNVGGERGQGCDSQVYGDGSKVALAFRYFFMVSTLRANVDSSPG